MKKLFILNNHSLVDVITNSSSELFVCDTKKSVTFIKEALQKLLDACNFMNDYEVDDGLKADHEGALPKFNAVFGDIGIVGEDVTKDAELLETLRYYFGGQSMMLLYSLDDAPRRGAWNDTEYDAFDKRCEEWWGKEENKKRVLALLKGKIYIYSAEDNSIPHTLQVAIENSFGADRLHLG